jgi:orotate phosphoribosyltransferase
MDLLEPFVVRLFKAGGIKIGGEYPTRHGPKHPIYIDMRVCMEDADLIKLLADIYLSRLEYHGIQTFCCVPLGSVYLTSILAYRSNASIIIPRSNGEFCGKPQNQNANDVCIVEDIVTTGKSLRNVQEQLEQKYRQQIEPCYEWRIYSICFLQYYNDYEHQGHMNVTTLDEVITILEKNRLVTADEAYNVYRFFHPLEKLMTDPLIIGLERPLSISSSDFKNGVVVDSGISPDIEFGKKSRVIVALDVSTWDEAKKWIYKLHSYVLGFKFHFDVLLDVDYTELHQLSLKYNFEILRDRKYGDISYINQQISSALMPGMINIYHGFVNLENLTEPSIVVLELSENCPLNNVDYRRHVIEKSNNPNIIGFVSQHKWWVSSRICFTPGVKTMEDVQKKKKQGANVIIVGRMVLESEDPAKTCQEISSCMSLSFLPPSL